MDFNLEQFLGINDIAKTTTKKDLSDKARKFMANKQTNRKYTKMLAEMNIRQLF